ncbi:Leucine-rich repeat-containing protein 49 [Thoreauomyces humboldtii]|nr:Leucine-rich repeat-containing protein 49 [Thoreauomyces humboldtii]
MNLFKATKVSGKSETDKFSTFHCRFRERCGRRSLSNDVGTYLLRYLPQQHLRENLPGLRHPTYLLRYEHPSKTPHYMKTCIDFLRQPLSASAAKNADPSAIHTTRSSSAPALLPSALEESEVLRSSSSQQAVPSRTSTPETHSIPSRASSASSLSVRNSNPYTPIPQPDGNASAGILWISKAEESLGWTPKRAQSIASIYEMARPAEEPTFPAQEGGRERINLSRRGLSTCVSLYQETGLRFLNYQNNTIVAIEHLGHLTNLVFLDFYNNQIEVLSGLDSLVNLRVLLLGRNRIREIGGLGALAKLDVLDLHSNRISVISDHMRHLRELRVLNLEDNLISGIVTFGQIENLAEANKAVLQITGVKNAHHLENLKRCALAGNDISSFDDISDVLRCDRVFELALENNPVCSDGVHRAFIINRIRSLKVLDGRRVSEEERRSATNVARRETEKRKESERIASQKDDKERAIAHIRKRWDLEAAAGLEGILDMPIRSSRTGDVGWQQQPQRPASALRPSPPLTRTSSAAKLRPSTARVAESGFFQASDTACAELENGLLTIYGDPSVALDRADPTLVTSVSFTCISVIRLAPVLARLKRFPFLKRVTLSNNHITKLKYVNHLALLRNVQELEISTEENPAVSIPLFRQYVVFRLSHLPLKVLCSTPVTAQDVEEAEATFGSLRRTVARLPSATIWRTPDATLPLGLRISGEGADDQAAYETALQARAALPRRVAIGGSAFVKGLVSGMSQKGMQLDIRRKEFDALWPSLVKDAVLKGLLAEEAGSPSDAGCG